MNDDKSLNRSTEHELEDVLRTLTPRAPELNVELICASTVERAPSVATNVDRGFPWLAFGAACAASAIMGAGITLAIAQSKLNELQDQVAALTKHNDVARSDTQTGRNSRVPAQDDRNRPLVRPAARKPATTFPLLATDTVEQRLIVGSHLKRVAFQYPVDRSESATNADADQEVETPGSPPSQTRPTTRAAILADLLDT